MSNSIENNTYEIVYSIRSYVALLEKSCKNDWSILSRVGAIVLPIFELHAAIFCLASAFVRIPVCIVKIGLSLVVGFATNHSATAHTEFVKMYQFLPGPTDILILIGQAVFCTLGIVVSPFIGLYDPILNAKIHRLVGLSLQTLPKTEEDNKADYSKLKGFDDIVGMNDLKEEINNIIDILQCPEEAKEFGIGLPNGLLFDGPPGCGKTFFAKKLSEEISKRLGKKVSFQTLSSGNTLHPYINKSAQNIQKVFQKAKLDSVINGSISVVFIDEINTVIPKIAKNHSNTGYDTESEKIRGEFLQQLDGAGEAGVLVIGATNNLESMDVSMTRPGRFDRKVRIGLPEESTRYNLLKHFLKDLKCAPNLNLEELAKKIDKYSVSDIKEKVSSAAMKAFHMYMQKKKNKEDVNEVAITNEILMNCFNVTLSEEAII